MAQATIDGPNEHPIATADRIVRIESNPATWIHGDRDVCPCAHCSERISLAGGAYLAITLLEDLGHCREKTLVRVCSLDCYREWATEGMNGGW